MDKLEINNVIDSELKVFWGEEPKSINEATKVIKTNNLSYEGKISFENITFRQIDRNKIGPNYLKYGDLLIEKSGGTKTHSVGYVNYFDGEDNTYVANNFILVLRPNKNKIISKFLFYQIRYFYENGIFSDCYNKTTGIQNLKKETYLSKKIVVPSFEKQTKIQNELTNIELLISSKNKLLKEFDELIKSRFIEMFDSIDKKVPLKEICSIAGGYSFKSTDICSDGIKLLQIGNVALNDLDWSTTNYLPVGFEKQRPNFLLKEDDIVVALTRPIIQSLGNVKACIVKQEDLPCLLNQRVGKIQCIEGKSVVNYIFGCLMTEDFTEYVKSCCTGCSQPNISTKDIESYQVPNVNIESQLAFSNFKELIDKSKFVCHSRYFL